jgi:hypothetical protein
MIAGGPELRAPTRPAGALMAEAVRRRLARLADRILTSLLEVGCNVGRNLNDLHRAGVGPAETVLPTYAPRSVDLVFTMAVLEHIHPASRTVFAEIARVARRLERQPWSALWAGLVDADAEWDGSFRDFDAFLFEVPGPPGMEDGDDGPRSR